MARWWANTSPRSHMALHGRTSISTRQWSLGPCSPPFVACTRTATNTFQVRAGQQHEGRRASARPHDEERCHQARAYVAGTGRQGKERKVATSKAPPRVGPPGESSGGSTRGGALLVATLRSLPCVPVPATYARAW